MLSIAFRHGRLCRIVLPSTTAANKVPGIRVPPLGPARPVLGIITLLGSPLATSTIILTVPVLVYSLYFGWSTRTSVGYMEATLAYLTWYIFCVVSWVVAGLKDCLCPMANG